MPFYTDGMRRTRPLSQITELILHCAATPNGHWFNARQIDGWHAERGFQRDPGAIGFQRPDLAHIGYHFVIGLQGGVECGRGLQEIGAHARGHNSVSIGTCLIGTDQFTADQWLSLKQHVAALKNRFPHLKIIGHRDINPNKTCPGFDVKTWLQNDLRTPPQHLLESPTERRRPYEHSDT